MSCSGGGEAGLADLCAPLMRPALVDGCHRPSFVGHCAKIVPTNQKSFQDAYEIEVVLTIRNEKVEGSIPFSGTN